MTEETSCWILASIVSLEGGASGWYYAFCKDCKKKVLPVNDEYTCRRCGFIGSNPGVRYMMKVIVNDCTGCMNLLIWNNDANVMVGKSARAVLDISKNEKGVIIQNCWKK
ncbi:hypothetical protein PIB30_083957 [Stylosanthes scabra]|uniref:Replication factor A C-terminal domain-containing protein n=1 Tax=Stylosanthes scabra TaxID=79078 RepID=A0ABU6WQN5_9FABA|nr:hypothetical protein [Stylosanthes scabra]